MISNPLSPPLSSFRCTSPTLQPAPHVLPQIHLWRKVLLMYVKVLGRASWDKQRLLCFCRTRLGWTSLVTLFVVVVANVLSSALIFMNITARVMETFIIRLISGSQGISFCFCHFIFSQNANSGPISLLELRLVNG